MNEESIYIFLLMIHITDGIAFDIILVDIN